MQFWDCRQVHQKKLLSMLRTLPTPDPGSSSESHRVECEHALSQGVWRREPVGLAQQVSRDSFPASFVYSFLCPFLPSFSNHSHILPSFSSHPLIHSVGNSILPSFLPSSISSFSLASFIHFLRHESILCHFVSSQFMSSYKILLHVIRFHSIPLISFSQSETQNNILAESLTISLAFNGHFFKCRLGNVHFL